MKKISIFGKSIPIPILAILMSAILVTASAALLEYYGTITTEVDVEQSLKLDDLSWPDSITESISGVAGDPIPGDPHWLTNMADKIILASLTSTETGCPPGGEGGLAAAFPVFELDATVDDDAFRLVLDHDVFWGDITGISFDYLIETDNWENLPQGLKDVAVGPWIPQINIRLRDSATLEPEFGLAWHSFRTKITGEVGTLSSITYLKGDFYVYDIKFDLIEGSILYKDAPIELKNQLDLLVFNSFSQQAGDTSIDPNNDPNALPNQALSSQIVWVCNHVVEGGPDIVGIGLFPDATQEVLNFFMMYVFHDPAIAGTYTITTNVEPLYP